MDERQRGGWLGRLALFRTPGSAATARPTSGPQHAAPGRFSRRALWIVGGAAVWVLVVATLGTVALGLRGGPDTTNPAAAAAAPVTSRHSPEVSSTPAGSPSTSPTGPSPSPRTTTPTQASTQICRWTDNGGSFYLYVTSATAHNFAACAGGTRYGGTIAQLLSSGAQRRCTLGSDQAARNQATVGVYSGAARADRAAARAYCSTNGGSDSG